MTKLHDFQCLVNRRSYKAGWSLKTTARMDLLSALRCTYPSHNRKCPKNVVSFVLYVILLVSISGKLYYILLIWLTFQNDRKNHLSISVYHNIHIKDQRKWAFEWDFQNFFRNSIYYNIHGNRKESKEN